MRRRAEEATQDESGLEQQPRFERETADQTA